VSYDLNTRIETATAVRKMILKLLIANHHIRSFWEARTVCAFNLIVRYWDTIMIQRASPEEMLERIGDQGDFL